MAEPASSTVRGQAGHVTELLTSWGAGDQSALTQLIPLVHEELHRLAGRQMRNERHGHVLQTTAIVNEAYLRLVDMRRVQWRDRAHFFALSARLMRRILVDHARARDTRKRGRDAQIVSLDEATIASGQRGTTLVALDDALAELAVLDARKGRVVEMRFFGGLTVEETAEALHVSVETVTREWRAAKAWLLRQIDRDGPA
jgi:RNA polymerase sigma factor (TIGR02999 family)